MRMALRAMLYPNSFTCISCTKGFSASNGWPPLLYGTEWTSSRLSLGSYRHLTCIRELKGSGEADGGTRKSIRWDGDEGLRTLKRRQQVAAYSDRARETGTITIAWQQRQPKVEGIPGGGVRRLWISTPLHMGRRAAKIATKKGAQDKKKAKLYGRIGKQIVAAVKDAGPNPVSNLALGALLQTAKDYNIPKDIVDRNIKKASDKNQQDFEELTYEVYGLGGVGIVLEVLTDNNNRAAANIRDVVKKGGGKMAEKGSVLFNFKRTGVILVKPTVETTADDILLAAMDAGAEDVVDPSVEVNDEDYHVEDTYFKILTSVDQYGTIIRKMKEAGLPLDTDNSGLGLFPLATTKPDDEAEELNRLLIEKLLDLDDVDAVSSTQG